MRTESETVMVDRIRTRATGQLRKPPIVQAWERWANDADTGEDAQTQLLYDLLLQVRTLKLVVFWGLIGIPVVAVILTIVMGQLA